MIETSRSFHSPSRIRLLAALAALVFAGLSPNLAVAQGKAQKPMGSREGARDHAAGVALEKRGDEHGAFLAYLQAAEKGYSPAQRKLGEIYDTGNAAIERDYSESIRWYQKARENGEILPAQKPRMPGLPVGP